MLSKRLMLRFLLVPLLILPVALTACSDPEQQASEAFAALETEYSAEREAISEAQDSLPEMSEETDSAERAAYRALLEDRRRPVEELTKSFSSRFEALAQEFWGTGAGLEAKLWVMSRSRSSGDEDGDEEAREAKTAEEIDAIFEEYAESPHIEKLLEQSYLLSDESAEQYFGDLRENSPHANVRAAAIYYPASRELSRLQFEEFRRERERERGADGANRAEEGDNDHPEEGANPRAEIDADLQLLIDEYGDVPMAGSTYGEVAYAHLTAHTAEELAIGQPAPEILGSNVDGEEMRLSQFLGKVVVIDFWGDW